MIPDELDDLCKRQGTGRTVEEEQHVHRELRKLGVDPLSELGMVSTRHNLAMLISGGNSLEELQDPAWPEGSMLRSARFLHETWELQENFIPITSLEGEGGYLYDRDTGAIWDFELAYRDQFLAGQCEPMFTSFFDFLNWYLGPHAFIRTRL